MSPGFELFVMVGLMHMIATDFSGWAWMGVELVITTATHSNITTLGTVIL